MSLKCLAWGIVVIDCGSVAYKKLNLPFPFLAYRTGIPSPFLKTNLAGNGNVCFDLLNRE